MRPASSRLRLALFNIINVENKTILDLFAGCGCLGIEALSRGASNVNFVEQNRSCTATIKKNIARLGFQQNSKVILTDAFRFVQNCEESFQVVFIDPPFRYFTDGDISTQLETLLERILGRCIILAMKHPRKSLVGKPKKTYNYGDCSLSIYGR
jgi:16S rRNA (guanine(966)-N(2))-methyltransferase RsmD